MIKLKMIHKTQTRTAVPPLVAPRALRERIPSPSCYSRWFEARGNYIPTILSPENHENGKLIVEVHDRKDNQDPEEWIKVTYDTLEGRAYGVMFSPERVSVFLDRYDTLKGYNPYDTNIRRERVDPSALVRIVRTHTNLLNTLPEDVKAKFMHRL